MTVPSSNIGGAVLTNAGDGDALLKRTGAFTVFDDADLAATRFAGSIESSQVNYSWTVLYRLYAPRDFDSLYAIEELCFPPRFRFSRRYMHQIVSHSSSVTWVAVEDGQMGGFAIVECAQGASGTIGYIQTIEVSPDRRKQGIGRELLRRLEASARAASAQIVWLHVHAENAPAIRLYEANGYIREGSEEDYYAPGHAALIYGRPLESEPANELADASNQ